MVTSTSAQRSKAMSRAEALHFQSNVGWFGYKPEIGPGLRYPDQVYLTLFSDTDAELVKRELARIRTAALLAEEMILEGAR